MEQPCCRGTLSRQWLLCHFYSFGNCLLPDYSGNITPFLGLWWGWKWGRYSYSFPCYWIHKRYKVYKVERHKSFVLVGSHELLTFCFPCHACCLLSCLSAMTDSYHDRDSYPYGTRCQTNSPFQKLPLVQVFYYSNRTETNYWVMSPCLTKQFWKFMVLIQCKEEMFKISNLSGTI